MPNPECRDVFIVLGESRRRVIHNNSSTPKNSNSTHSKALCFYCNYYGKVYIYLYKIKHRTSWSHANKTILNEEQ